METPSGGIWNQTFSVAGLNTSVSQDGLRRKSTRTATAFLWPRTAENASAVPFVLFISTRSTDSRRDYPSSLRGSGHLRLVSFDTKEVSCLPAGSRCKVSSRMPPLLGVLADTRKTLNSARFDATRNKQAGAGLAGGGRPGMLAGIRWISARRLKS